MNSTPPHRETVCGPVKSEFDSWRRRISQASQLRILISRAEMRLAMRSLAGATLVRMLRNRLAHVYRESIPVPASGYCQIRLITIPHWGALSDGVHRIVFVLQDSRGIFQRCRVPQVPTAPAGRPDAGDLIRGTGGARKIRWRSKGHGKRGGVRVIYYWITKDDQILLLTAYAKNEAPDLTEAAKSEIKRLIQALK